MENQSNSSGILWVSLIAGLVTVYMFRDTLRGGVDMASASMRYLYNVASNNLGLSSFSDDELTDAEKARNIRRFRDARVGGLWNEGNTCFVNSVVQALASCDPILEYTSENKQDLNFSGGLSDLITNLNQIHTKQHGYSTLRLMRKIGGDQRWSRYNQEDAQEFFQELLTTLEKDRKDVEKASNKKAELDIVPEDGSTSKEETGQKRITPFDGSFAVRVGCLRCGDMEGIRTGVLSSVDLSLGMANAEVTLDSLLKSYCAMETISGVECYRCSLLDFKTKVEQKLEEAKTAENQTLITAFSTRINDVDAVLKEKAIDEKKYSQLKFTSHKIQSDKTKQTMFARPNPDVLMIHINRSVFDLRTGIVRKNFAPVVFPMTLDLAKYTTDPQDEENFDPHFEMNSLNDGESELYHLKAAVMHYGSANFGHYVSFRKYHGFWWRISDDQVDLTTEAQVASAQGVFMLFYEKEGASKQPEHLPNSGIFQQDEDMEQRENELVAESEDDLQLQKSDENDENANDAEDEMAERPALTTKKNDAAAT